MEIVILRFGLHAFARTDTLPAKDSPFIQMVNRLDPGDKVGILSKGLSEDNRPRLEIFDDNFSIIWGKPIQNNLGMAHRPRENILSLSGRYKLQLYMDRSINAGILQFFSGAVSYTGFRTGYISRHPGENEVKCGSSHKIQMKYYNLCLL